MLSVQQVRADLREIKYYYAMKDKIESTLNLVKPTTTLQKVQAYNIAMEKAPVRLYTVYVALYMKNKSMTVLAIEWGFSFEYIRHQNNNLIKYLQNAIKE